MEMTTVLVIAVVVLFLAVEYIVLENKKHKPTRNTFFPVNPPQVTPVHRTNGIEIGPKAYTSNSNDDFNATATTISVEGDVVNYIDDLTGEYKSETIAEFLLKYYLTRSEGNPRRRTRLFDEIEP